MDQFTICFWKIMSLKQDHVFGFGADSLGWLKIELVFGCKAFCPWWFRCFSGGWFMEPRQGVWNSRTEVFFARRWVVSNVQELTVSPIIFFLSDFPAIKTIQGVLCSISSVGRKCVPSGRMWSKGAACVMNNLQQCSKSALSSTCFMSKTELIDLCWTYMCSIWCRYTQILKIYFQFYSHASNSSTKEWHSWFSCRQDEFFWVVSSALIRIGRGLETIYTRTANASVHCPARAAWLTSKHLKAFQAKEFSGCECLISG